MTEAIPNKGTDDCHMAPEIFDDENMEADAPLFISKEGHITLASFILLIGIPLFLGGHWFLGSICILSGAVVALCNAMDQIAEEDKHDIRYNHMHAAAIMEELEEVERNFNTNTKHEKKQYLKARRLFQSALETLAKKIDRSKKRKGQYHPHEIECICQEAAYAAYRLFPTDDELVASALSLHALVAKDIQVRQRHIYEADIYGLNVPVNTMKNAMERAQSIENPPERLEQRSADLQRKACLLLGALADGDVDMATKIVDEGGLEAILEVLRWYRYHEDGSNWALWATFILCFDHSANKKEVVRLGGMQLICQTMVNIPTSLDVARHGTATMFDLLRQVPETPTDVAEMRKIAINAGLHGALRGAMDEFPECMEVMMMAQEMLIATGFKGTIPRYVPTS